MNVDLFDNPYDHVPRQSAAVRHTACSLAGQRTWQEVTVLKRPDMLVPLLVTTLWFSLD
jgi:hypothetical protein